MYVTINADTGDRFPRDTLTTDQQVRIAAEVLGLHPAGIRVLLDMQRDTEIRPFPAETRLAEYAGDERHIFAADVRALLAVVSVMRQADKVHRLVREDYERRIIELEDELAECKDPAPQGEPIALSYENDSALELSIIEEQIAALEAEYVDPQQAMLQGEPDEEIRAEYAALIEARAAFKKEED